MYRKSCCTTSSVGIGFGSGGDMGEGGGVRFYLMGKGLSFELSCTRILLIIRMLFVSH